MKTETTPPAFSGTGSGGRFTAVYRVLNDAIDDCAFPGCAFGVLASRETVILDALGRFTYEKGAPAVFPNTVFDVASLTKVVATTAAAMLLYQRGQLDLDTPLGELLPSFVMGRASRDLARHVSLRHLLAHNSGLPGYVDFFHTAATPNALLRACLELHLEAEPSVRTEYSDPGFILLGKALEVITREHLAAWVGREVFLPLGMDDTYFCPFSTARQSIPPTEEDTMLRHRRIQGEVQDENAWLLGGAGGHAGLFSNVSNLLRFAREILDAEAEPESQHGKPCLFDKATVQLFSQRQGPEGSSRALGWDTPSENSSSGRHFSARSIGHLGFTGCSLWIDLDAGVAVVLLTNRTWPDRSTASAQLIRQVRPAFHDAVRESL
jgi:CubicO group peptidase (beta-lactamase class C family)